MGFKNAFVFGEREPGKGWSGLFEPVVAGAAGGE
jgi:hypothetical protein